MTTTSAIDEGLSNGHDKSAPLETAKEAIQEHADAAKKAATEVQDQLGAEMRNLTDMGTKFVKENPGTALVGAVGLGVLIGLALNRD